MSTKTCGHKVPCGCGDTPLTTPPPCNESPECVGERCSELFEAGCIVYKGPDLACGEDVIVPDCTRVDQALANIVERLCETSEPPLESYVSNVTYNEETSELEITGEGDAFNGNVTIPSGNVYSNSIFVDAKYGDDATGEYGNFAKPFKTIIAAQRAAILFMNSFEYNVDKLRWFFEVPNPVVEHLPRVTIKVSPGLYDASDEFQYMIDNPTLFDAEQLTFLNPTFAKNNRSFNLMLNYVDYVLEAGAVLINYGFCNYSTTSAIMGYNDYIYHQLGFQTNVYGKGNIITYRTIAVGEAFFFGITPVYIERDCSIHVEGNIIALGGYTYGGTVEIKCNNYLQFTFPGGSEGGNYNWYFDNNRLNQKINYIECDNWIQCYYNGASFIFHSAFFSGGANINFKCKNFVGRNLDNQINLNNIKQYRSADGVLGWLYNYFIDNSFDPAHAVATYIDNYSLLRCNVNIEIDYLKVYKNILGVNNNSIRKQFISLKINQVDFIATDEMIESNLTAVDFYGNGSVYNTQTHIEINYIEVYRIDNGNTLDRFKFIGSMNGAHQVLVKDTNIKVRNTFDSGLGGDVVAFMGFSPSESSTVNISLILNNVVFESVNQTAKDYFITLNTNVTPLNIRLYNDSYSNVGNNVLSTIVNLIPSSNLIIDNNVIAI